MALKVKNPKKNLADILIEKERLNESYDSSSAVSLKTLEQSPEGEEAAEKAEIITKEEAKEEKRPVKSIEKRPPVEEEKPAVKEVIPVPAPVQERKPWEEVEEYNPPRKKRGRPYQGYAENTHVQSIYVRNDLYEYIMINYVGHGRKHSSFNKFVNAAINNYLRQLDEN